MVFYFTSTGNCLYVAREFDTKARSIPQEKLGQKYQDESIGVVCPVYWNDVPPIVAEFLRKATFETDYFYMVMTYGYRHGGAALRAKELFASCGKRLDYVNTLLMVDNVLPIFDMNEELANLPQKKVEENLALIKRDIAERKQFFAEPDQENIDYHKEFVKLPFHMEPEEDFRAKGLDMYEVSDSCVGCGICAKVCPAKCFSVGNGKAVHDMTNCLACLGCIHACPQKAIHFTFPEKNPNARYRHPNVSLADIIATNQR